MRWGCCGTTFKGRRWLEHCLAHCSTHLLTYRGYMISLINYGEKTTTQIPAVHIHGNGRHLGLYKALSKVHVHNFQTASSNAVKGWTHIEDVLGGCPLSGKSSMWCVWNIGSYYLYSRTPDERPPSPTTIPLIRPHFVWRTGVYVRIRIPHERPSLLYDHTNVILRVVV